MKSIEDIKNLAFGKYLNSISKHEAAQHLFDCLYNGETNDNVSWELMEIVHGEKFNVDANNVYMAIDKLRSLEK